MKIPTLHEWKWFKDPGYPRWTGIRGRISGTVTDHTGFEDGEKIVTSAVRCIHYTSRGRIVETKTGSLYHLEEKE